jgi:phenylacetate-coenzyme A ligase PaaK-like adenylate-forming protein
MTTTTIAVEQRRAARHARLRAALPEHLERRTWDAARVRAHQRDRLRALLRQAKARSPFHAGRLAGVDPARFELGDLPALPTMTKAEMMAAFDQVLADPGCRARWSRSTSPAAPPRPRSCSAGTRCWRPGAAPASSSAPDQETIVLASDLAIVELVDERHRPVPPGTPPAKVLVTNLMTPTQPLIRYELADRFVQQPCAAEHGHLRVTVEGRADELLGYGDVVVHPLVLRSVLVDTPAVVEYQVTQTRRGAHVAVVAPCGVDERALAARLAAALGGAGVGAAEVTVEPVPAIARHPDTGKARRFIPRPARTP